MWLTFTLSLYIAISETEPVLLSPPGMSYPGPHELRHQLGAPCAPVCSHISLRGAHHSW